MNTDNTSGLCVKYRNKWILTTFLCFWNTLLNKQKVHRHYTILVVKQKCKEDLIIEPFYFEEKVLNTIPARVISYQQNLGWSLCDNRHILFLKVLVCYSTPIPVCCQGSMAEWLGMKSMCWGVCQDYHNPAEAMGPPHSRPLMFVVCEAKTILKCRFC